MELRVLLHLCDDKSKHPGRRHVMPLLDHFIHDGPNGSHLCLVFPVMWSDLGSMTDEDEPYPPDYLLALSKQILLGLDFLHTRDIIHGGRSTIRPPCNRAFDNWLLPF